MALLEVENLTKTFAGLTAVDDVSLSVESGTIRALIGPNGAGKSTTINCVTGLLDPSAGSVTFDDEDITGADLHDVVQRGISKSFQTASIFPDLSVVDNVRVAAFGTEHGSFRFNFLRKRNTYDDVDATATESLESVGLGNSADRLAKTLSYGDKRRLEIAIALASDPELLFMDEPTAGMSPEETERTVDLVERLQAELGLTIVMVEHDMEVIFRVADHITVLHGGEVIADGTPHEVKGDPRVQKAYLGGVEI